jgi:hypothetical protein
VPSPHHASLDPATAGDEGRPRHGCGAQGGIGCAASLNWRPTEQATLVCGRSRLRSSLAASLRWRHRISAINSDATRRSGSRFWLSSLLLCKLPSLYVFMLELIFERHTTSWETFFVLASCCWSQLSGLHKERKGEGINFKLKENDRGSQGRKKSCQKK